MHNYNQKFKIFGRKKGRRFINKSKNEILNKYLLSMQKDFINKKIILDIGSGDGTNALSLAKKYPHFLIIASDIYQDGNINLCIELQTRKVNNVKIFDNNILLLFEEFCFNNFIKEIWILFPDPWPKNKHLKRRLINCHFIEKVNLFLEKNGRVNIATDCLSYFISILKDFQNSRKFSWVNDLPYKWNYNPKVFQETKYFKKALRNNKKPLFLIFEKI